jgi:hypothetical protein
MEIVGIIIAVLVIAYFVKNNSSSKSTTTPKVTPKATPKTTTTTVADKNANGITSKAELKTLTKMQLLELAEKQNLKVKKSGTKAAVINEIHSQLR